MKSKWLRILAAALPLLIKLITVIDEELDKARGDDKPDG